MHLFSSCTPPTYVGVCERYKPRQMACAFVSVFCLGGDFVNLFTTKKDTSVTFWAERNFFCHTYDTSMTIIVTKPGIIIDVVGSYFYDKKS